MDGYYIINKETGKLELHFEREDYQALTDAQKNTIKGCFLWGRNSGCWISRAKEPNLYAAKRVAEQLGLENQGKSGERLSFAEQMERQQERAERRADRYEAHAGSAAQRAETLQKPINDMHGDIAFFTQPNINSSAGRAFTNRRNRMFAAYEKGFDEYRKSDYWQERAATARKTASGERLKDKAFVCRRIKECESNLRKIKKTVDGYEETLARIDGGEELKSRYTGEAIQREKVAEYLEDYLDRMEAWLDKLGFYQDTLEALGGVTFSRDSIKPGYMVQVQTFGKCRVLSAGPENVTCKIMQTGSTLQFAYAEIESIINAEQQQEQPHPFKVGETFDVDVWNPETHKFDVKTFEIIRATSKSVTLKTGSGKPITRRPSKLAWSERNEWVLRIVDTHNGYVRRVAE